MHIQALSSEDLSNELLFDTYVIDDLKSFDELFGVYEDYKRNNPNKVIILTLDDLGQAEYTSGHSIHSYDLDETEGHDLSNLDEVCFENGEHRGYLSTPSEFFIRKTNLLKQAKDIDFESVCDKNMTIDEDEMLILEGINQSPFEYLDEQIELKVVPVDKSYEGICGFPNGYFESDFDPFENYIIAKHLFENYQFELFGIGASILGFKRDNSLEESKLKELITDLSKLYNTSEEAFDKFAEIIRDKKYLFLKYTEGLEA